jgi:hypothetical protein
LFFFFFDLAALNELSAEGVVEILKTNKTLETIVLLSEDNAQFQFHIVCLFVGDSNTHFFLIPSECHCCEWAFDTGLVKNASEQTMPEVGLLV